uniref:multidrug and toxin extrusion protein 1 n=1 Tax=Doryrhamphus excisus TaxID=161450 RepID=UPI0025AEBCB2|nr:multidrug and toxin extrusion protein 1 [Doryrhamphus excisus]XP_057936413.1 multidrug and toxin extrusion protein 1 [Doryrhamphus excisus]
MMASSSSTSWKECFLFRYIRKLAPVGFKTEVKAVSRMAVPVILTSLMVFSVSLISTVFCGHLGKEELAGVALAIAVINVTGISIGSGLSSACDTLISQTFGSGNLMRVGVILQRAILILILACFPCWAILINTEPILLAVGQEPNVARLSQLYVKIFMPALPATFMYSLETKYLQNQGIIWPQVMTGFVVNILNALFNYIFIFALNLGVAGSALANTLSQFSMAGVLYAYIIFKSVHKATWGGWSKDCLQDWGSFIHLAIPSMVMLCVEWWTFEIGSFLAGLISEVELGAQSIVYELSNVAFMFPLGFSVAGCVKVGNALGAGDTKQAKLSAKTAFFCAVSVSVCLAAFIGSLRNHIAYAFTYDEQISIKVGEVVVFYAPFILMDAASVAMGGIIRGTGMQKVGAVCNVVCYYGVALPIGVPLMFAAKLGIIGLWTGLCTSVSLQCLFLVFYLVRMDWKKVTVEAQVRAGVCVNSDDTQSCEVQGDTTNLFDIDDPALMDPVERELAQSRLVLRRGVVLALMLSILAAGIIMNILMTNRVT